MKVFVDTNVLLDVILARQPFVDHSRLVLEAGEQGKVQLYTSSLSLMNVHYIVESSRSKPVARAAVMTLRSFIEVSAVDESTLDRALEIDSFDFEDAVQYFSQDGICDVIVTRDKKGFREFRSPSLTPEEFLEKYAPTW